MKPADYRHRIPEDRDAEYIKKTVQRLKLFTDPTLQETMYPVDDVVRRQIYQGISRDGDGRTKYLKVRVHFVSIWQKQISVPIHRIRERCQCIRGF